MSEIKNYNKFLDEIIKEVEDELEESTATGNIDGYQTPYAFGDDSEKNKSRKKQVATQAGYTVVDNDVKNINEADRDYAAEYQARKKDYYKKYQSSDKAKKYRAELNQYNRKKGTYGNGDGLDASHKGGKIVGFETENKNRSRKEKSRLKKKDVMESKTPKRTNRWLELKNDESMHGHQKLATGLKELKYQLAEVEKFLGWYNKLKNINELDSDNYWKRTNNNIYKIKERLINIVKKIQEIEK
jgi:hypothetical protein